jgi:hypothetical protein
VSAWSGVFERGRFTRQAMRAFASKFTKLGYGAPRFQTT